MADLTLRSFQVPGSGAEYRLAIHGVDATQADALVPRARRIVAEQIRVFDAAPAYDYGTYTFLIDATPWPTATAWSTAIRPSSAVRSPPASPTRATATMSHELFHSWNMERLRSAELEPFDFTQADPSPNLWFGEGFTNYYGTLAMRRAGELSVDDFARNTTRLLSTVVPTAGPDYSGPQEMSLKAPFYDAATAIDPLNPNLFLSYYAYGQAIATALDSPCGNGFRGSRWTTTCACCGAAMACPKSPIRPPTCRRHWPV